MAKHEPKTAFPPGHYLRRTAAVVLLLSGITPRRSTFVLIARKVYLDREDKESVVYKLAMRDGE